MSAHRLKVTRIALVGAVAVSVVTCSDSPVSSPSDFDRPLFAISDGATDGNGDVFFLPPLVESPYTDPDFGDRPPNPYLAPVARVCQLNIGDTIPGTLDCVGDSEDLPMTYDMTGGFYKANLKDLVELEINSNWHYRIAIVIGSTASGIELAYRDVDPDDGPPVASCTTADEFCQYNNNGSGGLPVKVVIETGAACIYYDTDPSICATATLAEGGTLALQQNNDNLAVARIDTVEGAATINMQLCQDLRTRGSGLADAAIGRVDLVTFGDCIEITNLDNPLEVFGTVTQCDAFDAALAADLTVAQIERMTVHRFSGDDGFTAALPHGIGDVCSTAGSMQFQPFEFSKTERVVRLARRTWRAVSGQLLALIEPPPAWACHHGSCAGSGIFRSSYQVAQPARMEYHSDNPGGDLGTHDVGILVTGKVQAWDSGEFDDDPAIIPDPVFNVRLTVTVTGGTGSVNSTEIFTDANGIASFELTVGPGENTIEVSGIGVSTGPLVFAPPLDGTAEVRLYTGTLTFTAVGLVPLEFFGSQPDLFFMNEDGLTASLPGFTICTVGEEWAGMPFRLVAVNNNGSWVQLEYDDVPVPAKESDPYLEQLVTGEEGPPKGGCWVSDELLTVNKTGAYRLVLNPIFNHRDKVVDGEDFTLKLNVKPFNKK